MLGSMEALREMEALQEALSLTLETDAGVDEGSARDWLFATRRDWQLGRFGDVSDGAVLLVRYLLGAGGWGGGIGLVIRSGLSLILDAE